MNFHELLGKVKAEIKEISPVEANKLKKTATVFVDVREPDEWQSGVVPGAVTIARGFLELEIEETVPNKETEIVCYCAGGVRSALATKSLQQLGYKKVSSMTGGFNGWKNAGLPVEQRQLLSSDQMVH